MEIRFWGTRGSLATPGPETARYGGNTSCVEVRAGDGTVLVLDAGTGIRRLGAGLPADIERVDLLLSHLHLDHILGLGFFAPLYRSEMEVHIWGPASPSLGLRERLSRYLGPPLFPVHLRDLPCALFLHEMPGAASIGSFNVISDLVCHPGPTLGYRITGPGGVLAYLPDHEPALGAQRFPMGPDWTSGYDLAAQANVLIHDAQFTAEEYQKCVGWGHSSLEQTLAFARQAEVGHLVLFHHDPSHDDATLDRLVREASAGQGLPFPVSAAAEGVTLTLG